MRSVADSVAGPGCTGARVPGGARDCPGALGCPEVPGGAQYPNSFMSHILIALKLYSPIALQTYSSIADNSL